MAVAELSPSPTEAASAEQLAAGLQQAAKNHGITLQPDRLSFLAGKAERARTTIAAGGKAAYNHNGLFVAPASPLQDGSGTIAEVHFAPKIPEAPRGATTSQPQLRTQLLHTGIQELQNYALLVEAGALEQPDTLLGGTNNPEMAKIAERVGFRPINEAGGIAAPFDAVQEGIFAPEIIRLDNMLARRLAGEVVGSLAAGLGIAAPPQL